MILPALWWLSFICCLTLVGNVLVILAVYREVSLHSATYYYIVSLALADLCVGVLVIPLAILFELVVPSPFRFLCHLWHVMDVGASTASILALCVIAIDRYIAITSPIRYSGSFVARHSSIVIALIWCCSAVIAGPTVIILGERSPSKEFNLSGHDGLRDMRLQRCEFPSDPLFIIVSSSVSFYIPLLIMVFVYGRILISARRQMIAFRQGYKRTTGADKYHILPLLPRLFFRSARSDTARLSTTIENVNATSASPETITLRIHRGKYSRSPSLVRVSTHGHVTRSSSPLFFLRRLRQLRRTGTWRRFSREQKAIKVLGVIMGVFIACWLPFFVFLVLTGVFHVHFRTVEEQLFRLFTWLGYTNSALNFLVYALTSREFRLAFLKLLCPRRYVHRSLKQSTPQHQSCRL